MDILSIRNLLVVLDPDEILVSGRPCSRIELFAADLPFVTVSPSQAGRMTQT
jgi:hypothetical protein